ncbi:hypothetical protein BX600DRAFT_492739 [Xylariales sp. PMI_506]|nr:hypothetical protein BX600DRAFT_492739 [Xylariales sp. PMI_506]
MSPTDNHSESTGGVHKASVRVGIAAGTIAGVGLITITFVLWKWYSKRKSGGNFHWFSRSQPAGDNPGDRRRWTQKSDGRIMDELMVAAYSAENGGARNSLEHEGDYYNKKGRRPEFVDDRPPDLPPQPPAKPDTPYNRPIFVWLSRMSRNMLNPMMARASFVSNSTVSRGFESTPPSPTRGSNGEARGRRMRDTQRAPSYASGDDLETSDNAEITLEAPNSVQEVDLSYYRERLPPEPALPEPSKVRVPSMVARTETTSRSSGTWNTWGVTQHRDKPQGWMSKLGM